VTRNERRSEARDSIVEIFDIFAGVNDRLEEPFDLGRVKVALVCHYLFGEPGHLCGRASGCSVAIDRYYERVRPTGSDAGRAQRIDRLFARILRADEARDRVRQLDYRSQVR
jgi:hypothetical protein